MSKGARWIGGREYLLHGRYDNREGAVAMAGLLRRYGYIVRVIKLHWYDYMVYSHGPVENLIKESN